MNVHTLLADATASVDTTVAPSTVDADLARGRRALSRRRLRRGGVAGLVVAGALVGGVALGSGDPTPEALTAGPSQGAVLDPGAIQLVDYTGDQLAGFSVDAVPTGWGLLGADEQALTIGPAGAPDTGLDSYAGKLTVLLMSADAQFPTDGVPVQVGNVAGMVTANGGGVPGEDNAFGPTDPHDLMLYYVDQASGQPVVVQVPTELGWSAQQAADFAAGVHVTAAAERGVG